MSLLLTDWETCDGIHVHYVPAFLWRFWPFAGGTFGTQHHVWMRRGEELCLIHERVHLRQAQKLGGLRFLWRWLTSKRWRAFLESEAYAEDVRSGRLTMSAAAALLSSRSYGPCCTHGEAYQLIRAWAVSPPTY